MNSLNKASHLLFLLIAIFILLYFLGSFLIPLTFGIFLAMLIVPLSNFLEKYKFNIVLSSLASTIVLFIILGFLSYLFIIQISQFADQMPGIRQEIQQAIENLQQQIALATGVTLEEQKEIVDRRTRSMWGVIETQIAILVGNILEFSFQFLLVFLYAFLFLLYRDKFMSFIIGIFSKGEDEENIQDALNKISKVVYLYLWGRIQVMLILAIMYYITFLIFGLPFALLITLFGALITIIPYFGPLISGILPVTFALIFFQDLSYILLFSGVVLTIQLIESYVLEPYLIGKEVKLNALAVIIAVLLGGFFWGLAGMVLFVPIFATLKIISNHSKALRPLGLLLG